MAYYEINIVSERWIRGNFFTVTTYKYFYRSLDKEDVDYLWWYISNNRLMAAKQKMSFGTCIGIKKGDTSRVLLYGGNGETASKVFKKFCFMFEPKFALMQMDFTTPRDRVITVCITYRKK